MILQLPSLLYMNFAQYKYLRYWHQSEKTSKSSGRVGENLGNELDKKPFRPEKLTEEEN